MKKVLFTLFMAFGVLTYTMANGVFLDQDTKTEIKAEELPEAVKLSVSESNYADWALDKVYKAVDSNTGADTYEIQVKNSDGQKIILVYDAEGKLLKEEEDY
ncbi:MAG: hypothetical protein AAF843_03670 [Bacteroidota bacterium]